MSERRSSGDLRLVLYTDSTLIGGAETSAARLLRHLSSSVDVTIVGMDACVVQWLARHRDGARAVTLSAPRSRGDVRTLAAHVQTLRRLKPTIVQLNLITPWSCRYAVAALALLRHRRVVAVAHSPQRTDNRKYLRYISRAPRRFAAIVAVGRKTAREVEPIFGVGPGTVRTIYNGVEDLTLKQQARPSQLPIVGSLARLDAHKGFDVLLRAVVSVPDASVLLVGEGDERTALLGLASELGVADRLTLMGWQDRARDFLTAMDVYAAPSRLEGLPLGVCEAMLAGLPVVASDVGSLPEAVVDGETGLVVPSEEPRALADALNTVVADTELGAKLGANARARALRLFSVEAMTRAYESLYQELVT